MLKKRKIIDLCNLKDYFFQKSSVESCVGRGIIYISHGNILLQSLILSMYMSNSPSFVVLFSHKHKCLYKVDWSMMWCNHYFVSTCQFQILNNVELSNVHSWALHHGFTFSKNLFHFETFIVIKPLQILWMHLFKHKKFRSMVKFHKVHAFNAHKLCLINYWWKYLILRGILGTY